MLSHVGSNNRNRRIEIKVFKMQIYCLQISTCCLNWFGLGWVERKEDWE